MAPVVINQLSNKLCPDCSFYNTTIRSTWYGLATFRTEYWIVFFATVCLHLLLDLQQCHPVSKDKKHFKFYKPGSTECIMNRVPSLFKKPPQPLYDWWTRCIQAPAIICSHDQMKNKEKYREITRFLTHLRGKAFTWTVFACWNVRCC